MTGRPPSGGTENSKDSDSIFLYSIGKNVECADSLTKALLLAREIRARQHSKRFVLAPAIDCEILIQR